VLLARYFPENGRGVYYGRQLEIALEREFFHWITKRALNELARERSVQLTAEKIGQFEAHFYWPLRHRYPRRQIKQSLTLINEFSQPNIARAIGHHGEVLADVSFARLGFRIWQRKVREVDGQKWITGHDLDRLVERDGVRYGVEIKNQLGYIDQTEFEIKLQILRRTADVHRTYDAQELHRHCLACWWLLPHFAEPALSFACCAIGAAGARRARASRSVDWRAT
jgi:hypothetical protein